MIHLINVISPTLDRNEILLKDINFAYNIKPVHFFSRLFGLMPFGMVQKLNSDVFEPQVNIFEIIRFIFAIFVYLFLAFFYFRMMKLPSDGNESNVLMLGDKLLISSGLIIAAIMVIKNMIDRFKLIDISNKFISFDKKVS